MESSVFIGLAGIVVLGVASQWLAWRLNVPSILLLLIAGFLAGPVTGLLNPHQLLGNLLYPIISLAVAVILFEGGLHLRIKDLKGVGGVVRNLVMIGTLITWGVASFAAYMLLGLDLPLSVLLGAILTISGPTVIGPLLRHVRPKGPVASVLRWEGIVIDPIGAILTVLVFEAIISGDLHQAALFTGFALLKMLFIGSVIGFLGARLMVLLLRHYLVPDYLQNPVTLIMVIMVYVGSNLLQVESGLLAVTVMGIVLANQSQVEVRHIMDFKESLQVLLIASLFIILAAGIDISEFHVIGIESLLFLASLILVARPLAVIFSTIGADLSWRERLFMACMAPRGIVAAAVSSIFAIRLAERGFAQGDALVPFTFLVIVATVGLYGLVAAPLARRLGISDIRPQGTLIIGAHHVGRTIARALKEQGCKVLLVDTNWDNVMLARLEGIPVHHGNILSDYAVDDINLDGIGRLLAMTPNDEVNSLAVMQFRKLFGRAEVYQLAPKGETTTSYMQGRVLFGVKVTYSVLEERFDAGASLQSLRVPQGFTFDAFFKTFGKDAIPLFVVGEGGELSTMTTERRRSPRGGQMLLGIVHQES